LYLCNGRENPPFYLSAGSCQSSAFLVLMFACTVLPYACPVCSKRKHEAKYLRTIKDKKLKGQLGHRERVYAKATKVSKAVGEWLAPEEAGFLEAEGERAAH